MTKILLITHQPPPQKGGASIILYRLFRLFPKNSYAILTTYSQFASRHLKFVDPKMRLPCKYYFSTGYCPGTLYTRWLSFLEWFLVPFMLLKCLYVIKKENIDRILVRPVTGTFLLTTYLAHKITGIPLYLYMFDLFEEQMDKKSIRGFMAGPIERLTMRIAANVFVMSEALQEHYLKKYNRRTVLLPHPIDLKDNIVIQGKKDVKSEAKYKILLTAGMIYHAHIDAIINLIRAIQGMPKLEFHIYARNEEYLKRLGIEGTNVVYCSYVDSITISTIQRSADILFLPMAFNYPPYKEIIKTASPGKLPEYLASGTPILVHAPPYAYISWYARKYVKFVGFVNHDKVALYHKASDLMVSVSQYDSGPIALQEAMACGDVPVISILPSVRELVKDGWNVILVDPNNVDQIADSIIRLLENDQMRKTFAERNWKLIQEKGDQEYWMGKMEKLYYNLIQK